MINALDPNGYSQLMYAAVSGDAGNIRDLLKQHKDIDLALMCTHPNARGCTALVMAAFRGHIACIRPLLANMMSGSLEELKHALFCAIRIGHAESVHAIVHAILHHGGGFPDLIAFMKYMIHCVSMSQGHADCMKVMLNTGVFVDVVDGEGSTLLMLAAAGGHSECVELFLDFHTSLLMQIKQLSARNKNGFTAWAVASNATCADLIHEHTNSLIDHMECACTLHWMKRSK